VSTREVKVELRRRAHSVDDPSELHGRFVEVMREVGMPWWKRDARITPVNLDGKLECQIGISRGLPGHAEGSLAYVHRGTDYLQDKALFDDRFVATFQVDAAAYKALATEGFKLLLSAFAPYRGQIILDEDLALDDWDAAVARGARSGKDEDGRDGIYRLWPVSFFDEMLCGRAFGKSATAVLESLASKVERVELCYGGVFIIATSSLVDAAAVVEIDKTLRQLL
jgi:hypothetical protein